MKLSSMFVVCAIVGALSASLAGKSASPHPRRQTAWKSDPHIVLLHRAAGMAGTENTAQALEQAVKQGADGVEIDIRKTLDGVLVLYHDDWVLRQRGPSGHIEEMTLSDALKLDVGERFNPKWRGQRPPLFEDVLRFAKANGLRLFLDIKTEGIHPEVLALVRNMDCYDLLAAVGGTAPPGTFQQPIPWISHWSYNKGGEEDPETMREVAPQMPPDAHMVIAEDVRSLSAALGRKPELRPFTPFISTSSAKLASMGKTVKPVGSLDSPDPKLRRAECLRLSQKPDRRHFDTLIHLTQSDPDADVRMDACWALGSLRDKRAIATLERIANTRVAPELKGAEVGPTLFYKIAGASALTRIGGAESRKALRRLMDSAKSFDRDTAAVALSTFGNIDDIQSLIELVDASEINDGMSRDFVLGEVGRLGVNAASVFLAAIPKGGPSKRMAVFGLVNMGNSVLPTLDRTIENATQPESIRHGARLARDWMVKSR